MTKSAFYELRHEDGTVTRHRRDKGRRLTNAIAREIRIRIADGVQCSELARAYGINHATVQRIRDGLAYVDAGGPIATKRCSKCGRTKMRKEFGSHAQCRKCREQDGSGTLCEHCCGLPHRRPKRGLCRCGEPYRALTDPSMRAVRGIQSSFQRWEKHG